jgi:site-specific recombinase XerD
MTAPALRPLAAPDPTPAAADTAIADNLRAHQAAAHGAYAGNTERALRADVLMFSRWCAEMNHPALPAAAAAVAAFIDAMAARQAPASIRRAVSSVANLHRAAGLANPDAAPVVTLALKRCTARMAAPSSRPRR